jgi:hypothetical protein
MWIFMYVKHESYKLYPHTLPAGRDYFSLLSRSDCEATDR